MMDEHPPSVCPDQPLNRRAPAMGPQLVAALPVSHSINGSLAIELRSAFPQAQQRPSGEQKRRAGCLGIHRQLLHGDASARLDMQRRGTLREADDEIAGADRLEGGCAPRPSGSLAGDRLREPAIQRNVRCPAAIERQHRQAHRRSRDRGDDDFNGPAGNADVRGLPSQDSTCQERAGARRADLLHRTPPGNGLQRRHGAPF